MESAIDRIMSTVTSRSTAEVARQELRLLLARQDRERAAAAEERDAARQDRFILLQRVATLEELVFTRNKFSLTRQDDLLRHVLSSTVDFRHFKVLHVAAVGGCGVVLMCTVTVPAWCTTDAAAADARTAEVVVAVKLLAGVADPRHTTIKHAFLREFHTLSDMPPHPNVITLLAYFTKSLPKPMYDLLPDGFRQLVGDAANPVLALIMPLYPLTLEAATATADPSPAQLVQWCLDVSAAVAHMWRYGWVHLDLKLNNVMVASDGRAVLIDMGTAMPVAADGSLTVPAHMGLAGNPAHRAPEVLASWEEAIRARDPAAQVRMEAGRQEVWALGVLLHELVVGKHPYGKNYPGEDHDGAPVVNEAALVARGLPADTVAVLRRMVSRDPGARPADPATAHAELVASVPAAQRPAEAAPAPLAPVRAPEVALLPPRAVPAPEVVPHPPRSGPEVALHAPRAVLATEVSRPAPPPVPLHDVVHAFNASTLNILRDNATGNAMPNKWGEQLLAWSERSDAARMCLAELTMWGWGGTRQDPGRARALAERSMAWCRDAAERGVAEAQWLLGMCCIDGLGVPMDHERGVMWYRRAAAQGKAEAQFWLGECYMHGQGVPRDSVQAAAWFQLAALADQGDAWAQLNLGNCYKQGNGVPADRAQAATWFRRAATQGHAEAQYQLGVCLYEGLGVDIEPQQAVEWFRRAAEQCHGEAARFLRLQGL